TDAIHPIPPGTYCALLPIPNEGYYENSTVSRAACLKFVYTSPTKATLEYKSADQFYFYLRYNEIILDGEDLYLKRRGSTEGLGLFPYIKTKFSLTVPADPTFIGGAMLHPADGTPSFPLAAGACTPPPRTVTYCDGGPPRALMEEELFDKAYYTGKRFETDYGDTIYMY
ncbi:hypothetical protein FOZ62_020479, partial [Perkinsus olseni]